MIIVTITKILEKFFTNLKIFQTKKNNNLRKIF